MVYNIKFLGIAIKKNELCYSVVGGTEMSTAVVIETGKHNFRSESPTQLLMMDFSNIFTELIVKFKPERVVYKLYLDANMQQISYMHYSLGVLNLVCQQNGVEAKERSNKWITANKKSKIAKFEQYFSKQKFKNEEMSASLISWFELEA